MHGNFVSAIHELSTKNRMIMSPFIIFVIVLTIAYVLYYVTIITMDLNAKSKKEGEHEETISASDTQETEEEYAPQTVLEDTKTGGFSFIEPNETSENPVEEVTETEPAPAIDEGPLHETTETSTDENEDNHFGTEDQSSQEDNPEDDKEDSISTSVFSEEATSEEKSDELFDESKAFDQDFAQPKYTVSSIIDNEKDAALTQRIDTINQRLVDCRTETKSGLRNPMQLASEIRENREHSNIDFKDEYTQC